MKTLNLAAGISILATAAMMLPSTATAAPEKPMNAATTDSGTLCIVHEADGAPSGSS